MHLKAVLLLAWLAGSYYLLVFHVSSWPGGVLAGLSLALAMAAVGFNIQHDGNHGSFSSRPWMNRLAGLTLDLLGASSYLWIWKHNFSHHTYTNIPDLDDDIDLAPVGRLSAEIPLRSYHRYQHYYLWFFYALLVIQWHFYNDYKKLLTGKIGDRTFEQPRGWDLAGLVAGKVIFLSLAFIIPFLCHRWWVVVAFYLGVTMVVGLVISVVFQLAHIIEETEHPALSGRCPRRVGDSPDSDHRRFRAREPLAHLVSRRIELPGYSPPLPEDLPCSLSSGGSSRRAGLQRVSDQLPSTPFDLLRNPLPLSVPAVDGTHTASTMTANLAATPPGLATRVLLPTRSSG